ncbi:hypothetical protein BJV77DRAFT_1050785 [Russula vinacea]|nr:hypothetical protein BJV77DRAFT_1054680 [Russula vinacea]KAH9978428.1 hypothetical protein BJV77DRAFT_1050785 [Russula vinacea]
MIRKGMSRKPSQKFALGESSSRVKTRDIDLGSPVSHHDTVVCPKERAMEILAQVDREMGRIKERDHHWEDGMENADRPQPVTQAQRHFKWFPPPEASQSSSPRSNLDDSPSVPEWRVFRVRRGCILHIDRRTTPWSHNATSC